MIRSCFICIPFAVGLLVVLGLAFPRCRQLQVRTRTRAVWTIVILFCSSKFLFFRVFGGDEFNPDLPTAVIWIWDWLYSGAMLTAALALVTVFVRSRAKLWILPALAWGMSAVGLYNGFSVPEVREVELAYAGLPASLEGYRIVQLSDLHCSSAARRWRTQAVVDVVNGLDADLVCLTGDYVDGLARNLADDLFPLTALRAKDGVCCIRGNHEYYGDWLAWREWYEANGFRMLVNECVFPRKRLAVGGVNDDVAARRLGDVQADVGQAFAAATNGEFRILLEHRPICAYTNLVEHGVDLQLSGHTHGGVAPLIDRVVALRNRGYVRGEYRIDGRVLYVSSGCGQWVGFPMRFFNDSEITLLTLRRK